MTPIFSRSWFVNRQIVSVRFSVPASLRSAWLISLAWRPTWGSPISPSISAFGASAATESIPALTPKAEIEGEMGDTHVGLQARLMSQALRKLAGTLNRTDTICLFTNQLREKIGVMFGNPETTPGGRALRFYASVRLDIRRIETLKDGVEAI